MRYAVRFAIDTRIVNMSRLIAFALIGLLGLNCLPLRAASPARSELRTLAEQSGYKRTGRYDEVEAAVRGIPAALAAGSELFRVRSQPGRPADARTGGLSGRHR